METRDMKKNTSESQNLKKRGGLLMCLSNIVRPWWIKKNTHLRNIHQKDLISVTPEDLPIQVLVIVCQCSEAGRAYIWGWENQGAGRIPPVSHKGERFCANWNPFKGVPLYKDTCTRISVFSYLKHPSKQTRVWIGKVTVVRRIINETHEED